MFPLFEPIKTLGESYKHVNKLIRDFPFDSTEIADYNASLNVFEKKLQAIFIDTYKSKEGVINCLLSEDPHLVRRILKCEWFFQGALTPKAYEEEIFPNVSLSTRCKIINKLARNVKSEEHAEEFFQLMTKNYGNKFAEMFLPKCSLGFILNYITEGKPSFNHHDSERNLINICKRFPEVIIPFVQNEMENKEFRGSAERCSKLVKYLAKHHPIDFLGILEKNYEKLYYFHFGKKSSKILHSELMKLAEKNPDILFSGKINTIVIFKCLDFEEQLTFLKLLVQAKSRSNYRDMSNWSLALKDMRFLLKLKPPRERVRLIETLFFQLFNEKYIDHPEMWSLQFLEVFPVDYRLKLVDVLQKRQRDKTVNDIILSECMDRDRDVKDILIYLQSCDEAFPLLTQLMNQMRTVEKREVLLREMIRNAIINKDSEGLEAVIKYISVRHKNEDPVVLNHLITSHLLRAPKLMTLRSWEMLESFASMMLVNLKDRFIFGEVLENYIIYKIRHRLDPKPQVKNMVKLNFASSPTISLYVRRIEHPYCRAMLTMYYNEIFCGDKEYAPEEIQEKLVFGLLMSIDEYNKSTRYNKVDVGDLPLLLDVIDRMIEKIDTIENKAAFMSAVANDVYLRDKYAGNLLDFSVEPKTLQYLLKSHPDCIIEKLDKIINNKFELSEKFDKAFNSKCEIDYFNWMPKLEKTVCEKFKTSTSPTVKIRALKIYSHIANLEKFIKLVKEYIPKEDSFEFDIGNADFQEVQINVPRLIKNLKPAPKNLGLILKYLNKDFVRFVHPSFLSVCHNSSVKVIIPILKNLFPKKDPAVKIVLLSCILDLLTIPEKLEYSKYLWESGEHVSVKEFLLNAISRTLKEDPSEEIFEVVQKWMSEVDEVAFTGRLSMSKVPLQFLNEYSSTLWKFTEKYEGRRFSLNCRQEIINRFCSKDISYLSDEICERILKRYLFAPQNDIRAENLCCHYLLYHPQTTERKLEFVLELMKNKRTEYGLVGDFINLLKNMATADPEPVFNISEALLKEWPEIYGTYKMFKEYLLLNYMKAYSTAIKISDRPNEAFGAELGKEFRKIVNAVPMYHFYVDIFHTTFLDFISHFKFQDILEYLIDNFLGSSFDQVEGIIAIMLLPKEVIANFQIPADDLKYYDAYTVGIRERYNSIFTKLTDKKDDVLKVYMNIRMGNVFD